MPFRSALVVLVALPAWSTGRAQDVELKVDHYSTEQGLARNWSRGVAQDSLGFIWIATKQGLQRFDGHRFVPYASLAANAPVELGGEILGLLRDRSGLLWVLTPDATFHVDPIHRAHRRLDAPPARGLAWAIDSSGALVYVAGDTLRTLRTSGAISERRALPPDEKADIQCLTVTREGQVWSGSRRGGTLFVRQLDAPRAAVNHRIDALRGQCVLREGASGDLWLGGAGGLQRLSAGGSRFVPVTALAGRQVVDLLPDVDDGIWVLSYEAITHVGADGSVRSQWSPPEAFGNGPIHSDFERDREGGFWVASLSHGLFRIGPSRPIFRQVTLPEGPPGAPGANFIMSLHEAGEASLWLGSLGGGILRVVRDGTPRWAGHRRSIPSNEVWDLEHDSSGTLWAATTAGLCRLDDLAGRDACFTAPGEQRGFSTIEPDRRGGFWLAAVPRGITRFDPATRNFGPFVRGPEQPYSLHLDHDRDVLWIGTFNAGLWRVRVVNGASLDSPRLVQAPARGRGAIFDFHRDRHGTLWMASDHGIARFQEQTDSFVQVDVPALRGTTVFSIAEDDDARLWLGTSHGLVSYLPSTGTARRYHRREGVGSGEFNRRAALRLDDGTMVFGGVQGLTVFDPREVAARRPSPVPVLTNWKRVMAAGTVEAPLDAGASVRLLPGDRAFTIDFATLTFASDARRYRYTLENLDGDWIETTEPRATYGAPPPGRYTFHVQSAIGGDSEWTSSTSLFLTVVPPFYAATWFRLLVVTTIVLSLWSLHRFRLRRALEVLNLRLRISRDLHDEVGAGLSSIALFADAVGRSAELRADERKHLVRISQAARDMVADLRDIVWTIDPHRDRLDDLVSRMRDTAAALLRGAQVTFQAPPDSLLARHVRPDVRRDVYLLFKELVHNVARHAGADRVEVNLAYQDGHLALMVSDNGTGFDAGATRGGTGLRSVHERAARLNGKVDVHSDAASGTIVRVSMEVG